MRVQTAGRHSTIMVNPALRALIDAIEVWPSSVAHAATATRSHAQISDPLHSVHHAGAGSSGGGGGSLRRRQQGDHYEERRRPSQPEPVLSSSLRAPAAHRLSSIVSAVPQRDESWLATTLGPDLGPGTYGSAHSGPGVLLTNDAKRRSVSFASASTQRPALLGQVGEPPLPDGMYTLHPQKLVPKVRTPTGFASIVHRFGVEEQMMRIRLSQLPRTPRRTTPAYHGAPRWDAPFHAPAPDPALLRPPHDHAERLRAARASQPPPPQQAEEEA